jgi:hypothetical protein
MRAALALVGVPMLACCANSEQQKQNTIMDTIEESVALPAGARPMAAYARYYAFTASGHVRAHYRIPRQSGARARDKCEEGGGDGRQDTTLCSVRRPDWYLPAGRRTWMIDEDHLPYMSDAGCLQVEIEFDPEQSKVLSVQCSDSY